MSDAVTHIPSADAAAGAWFSPETVYIRAGLHEGRQVFMICDSEGTEMAAAPNRDLAFAIARQNSLDPVSVH
jgi:hypothetical protein